jgi:hypothetical protein
MKASRLEGGKGQKPKRKDRVSPIKGLGQQKKHLSIKKDILFFSNDAYLALPGIPFCLLLASDISLLLACGQIDLIRSGHPSGSRLIKCPLLSAVTGQEGSGYSV